MFKKNKNGDEAVTKAKIFKDRKSKKEKKSSKDESELFRFSEFCTFKDFRTYCVDLTADGDWVINLGGKDAITDIYTDAEDPAEVYNEDLTQVYRHQDSSLVTKNTKMLGIEDGRLRSAATVFCYFVERKIHKHRKDVELISKPMCEFFDRRMKNSDSGIVHHIHIWVPVQKTTSKDCLLIKLLDGRINIIIT